MIHSLVIGINKYRNENINELSGAVPDAIAVNSLIIDTFSDVGITNLLLDDKATFEAIKNALEELIKNSSSEDVVLVYFSGHGSKTFNLVCHDYENGQNGLDMNTFVDRFSQIKAKLGLLLLDSCFSGGAGSKVLQNEPTQRDELSISNFLTRFTGSGKAIVTASNSSQSAWEGLEHGIFTQSLIKALTEAPFITGGKKEIFITALAEYLISEVKREAQLIGKNQEPTFKSNISGEIPLPLFKKGNNFLKNFPDEAYFKTSEDINDLSKWGYPQELIESILTQVPSFNSLQIKAINEFNVLRGENLIVSAPTSSGKTLIAEVAFLRKFLRNKKTIMLFPMKALVNDKYYDLNKIYNPTGLRIIRSTGDFRDEDKKLNLGQYDLCLMTYEKFNIMVSRNPHLLSQLGLLVVDEVQMIMDANRGIQVEMALALTKSQKQNKTQIICLSGVVGNINGLDKWLNSRILIETERPVTLEESIITFDGTRRYKKVDEILEEQNYVEPDWNGIHEQKAKLILRPLVKKLVMNGEKVIVFRNKIGETTGTAKYLAEYLNLASAEKTLSKMNPNDPSLSTGELSEVLSKGVAFHNGNLSPAERVIVEKEFKDKDGELKVIVATTTLSMGINTPADTVIIADLDRVLGGESIPYQVGDYKNMIGRAGRLGYSDVGKSFIIVPSRAHLEQKWSNYVLAHPEDMYSTLSEDNCPNLLIKILSTQMDLDYQEIKTIYMNLYGNYLKVLEDSESTSNIEKTFENAYQLLIDSKLIEQTDGIIYLTELGRVSSEEGLAINSVINLSGKLQSVPERCLSVEEIIFLTLTTDELSKRNFYFPVNERSVKERQEWQNYLHRNGLSNLFYFENNVDVLKKFASIHLYISGTPLEEIELTIQSHSLERQQSGRIVSLSDRVKSFVRAIVRIHSLLFPNLLYEEDLINELIVRLELGIPLDVVNIAQISGLQLDRGEYLLLHKLGIQGLEDLEKKWESIKDSVPQNLRITVESYLAD